MILYFSKNDLTLIKKYFSFYFEAVKFLKRLYNEHPEKCPVADFGTDSSKKLVNYLMKV